MHALALLYVLFVLLLLLAVRVHFLLYSFCIFFVHCTLCIFVFYNHCCLVRINKWMDGWIMMPPTSARVREATKPSSIHVRIPNALPAVDGIWHCMCARVLCTLVISEHCAVVKCMWYSDVYLLLCKSSDIKD